MKSVQLLGCEQSVEGRICWIDALLACSENTKRVTKRVTNSESGND